VISRSREQRLAHGKLWDAYCPFNDLHAMLAYVGAQDWRAARQLETALLGSQAQRSRYGETTRLVRRSALYLTRLEAIRRLRRPTQMEAA
jgi:hypothetical protein